MNDVFVFNSSVSALELIDAIYIRLSKIKAITSCLLFCKKQDTDWTCEMLQGVFFGLNDYLEEMEFLHKKLAKKVEGVGKVKNEKNR